MENWKRAPFNKTVRNMGEAFAEIGEMGDSLFYVSVYSKERSKIFLGCSSRETAKRMALSIYRKDFLFRKKSNVTLFNQNNIH